MVKILANGKLFLQYTSKNLAKLVNLVILVIFLLKVWLILQIFEMFIGLFHILAFTKFVVNW